MTKFRSSKFNFFSVSSTFRLISKNIYFHKIRRCFILFAEKFIYFRIVAMIEPYRIEPFSLYIKY